MEKQAYTANYYNVNGLTCRLDLDATTLPAAKREATRLAAGTITHVTITEPDGYCVAERFAMDLFTGCCQGWKRWETT